MLHQVYNKCLANWSRVTGMLENSLQISHFLRHTTILQNVGQFGVIVPTRNTFILKRRKELRALRKGYTTPKLPRNAYIYDVVEHPGNRPKEYMNVVLTSYIKGLGQQGDCVTVTKHVGYNKLIAAGLGDYPTPENIHKWKSVETNRVEDQQYSSIHVERTISFLNRRVFLVVMNKENEWTLEPWHIRASLRRAGVHVNDDSCLELPPQKIEGPNTDLEGQEFYVTLTINKKEKVKLRCRLYHWSSDASERFNLPDEYWLQPAEKIFPEEESNETSTKI